MFAFVFICVPTTSSAQNILLLSVNENILVLFVFSPLLKKRIRTCLLSFPSGCAHYYACPNVSHSVFYDILPLNQNILNLLNFLCFVKLYLSSLNDIRDFFRVHPVVWNSLGKVVTTMTIIWRLTLNCHKP